MKRSVVALILAVLLWLITTGMASALPICYKQPILDRAGAVTTTTCEQTKCGNCGNCGGLATATYIYSVGSDGYWLTSLHAVANTSKIWVNRHVAEISHAGCTTTGTPKCGDKANEYGCNWAVLRTPGYVPCGVCDVTPSYDGVNCGQGLVHVNIGKCGDKCGDIRKVVVTGLGPGKLFRTNLMPGCWNCGGGAYNLCGELVGVLVAGGKEGCGCCKTKYEEFILLDPRMFEVPKA